MLTRRGFLKSASAGALLLASPTFADDSSSGFNNGKSQIQSTVPEVSGDFPFINLLKVSDTWQGTDAGNGNVPIDPSWLDTNGYPLASKMVGSNGVFLPTTLPNFKSRPANADNYLVVTWEGNAVIRVGNISITGGLHGTRTSASFNSRTGLWTGRYEWYPNNNGSGYDADGNASFQMVVMSIKPGSYVNNLQCFFVEDEPALLAGNIFGTQYKTVLQQAGAGVFRAMDWLDTNGGTTTTWASRKSIRYPIWSQNEYRASLYDENASMTNAGNNYSLTSRRFSLVDKLTMHVHFNATSTLNLNSQKGFSYGASPQTLIVSLSPAITFGWPSHPFADGDPVGCLFSGNPPSNMQFGVNYYVINKTAESFQIALEPGGTALAPARLQGLVLVVGMPTLSLNGSSAYPIRDMGSRPLTSAIASLVNTSAKVFATVVFDSTLRCWLMSGGTPYSAGLSNGVPVEVILRLCKELGMHPFFSVPALALDKMTDYVPSLAAEIKNNWPSWMIPRFEAGNEVWNALTSITGYAFSKTWAYWKYALLDDWCGMVTSTMGQAVATVYGHENLGKTYEVLVGVQTDGMTYPVPNPSLLDPRMTSAKYIGSGPAQSGYNQSAASDWSSAVLVANYISPGMRGKIREWQVAFDYHYTSAGDPTQQAADLNAYVETLVGVNTGYTIPYEAARWRGAKDWASRFGVKKMFAYEGGYSPDLMPGYFDQSRPFDSAMQCNPAPRTAVPTNAPQCVIDIRQAYTADAGVSQAQQAGNPCVVGMLVNLAGVNGMTKLNCLSGFPVFTAGAVDVTWTAHNLNVNQVVQFGGGNLPRNVAAGQRYYVVSTNLTTNTFQFAATRGGAPIVPNSSAGSGVSVFSAFVVVNVSGASTTIDVDTSSYPAATSVPYVNFPNSLSLINKFRTATLLYATNLKDQMTGSYAAFAAEGGAFPSQYEVSGTGSIWPLIQPDVYGFQGGEFAAIAAYNR